MEPRPSRPSIPFGGRRDRLSTTIAQRPRRAARRPQVPRCMGSDGPHGQHITSGRLQRDNLLVEGGARLRAYDGRVRGRRGATTPSGWPGDLGSSRGPTDPLRVRVLGRRAVHDVSIDVCGENGVILAPVRCASHVFVFFNFAQFERRHESTITHTSSKMSRRSHIVLHWPGSFNRRTTLLRGENHESGRSGQEG